MSYSITAFPGVSGDFLSAIFGAITNEATSAAGGKGTASGDAIAAATAAALQAAQAGGKAAWDAATSGGGGGTPPSDDTPIGLTDADAALVFNDLVTKYHVPPAIAGNIVAKAKSLLQQGNSPEDVFNNYILPATVPYNVKPTPRAPKQFTTPGYASRPTTSGSWWASLSQTVQTAVVVAGVGAVLGGVWLYRRKSK